MIDRPERVAGDDNQRQAEALREIGVCESLPDWDQQSSRAFYDHDLVSRDERLVGPLDDAKIDAFSFKLRGEVRRQGRLQMDGIYEFERVPRA